MGARQGRAVPYAVGEGWPNDSGLVGISPACGGAAHRESPELRTRSKSRRGIADGSNGVIRGRIRSRKSPSIASIDSPFTGPSGRELALQFPRTAAGQHRVLPWIFQIVRNPLHQAVSMPAEVFAEHVSTRGFGVVNRVGFVCSHYGSLARYWRQAIAY